MNQLEPERWLLRCLSTGMVEEPHSARFHLRQSGRHPVGTLPVGGQRMSQMTPAFAHRPVMVDEIVDLLGPVPPGTFLDATVGGGGHARAVLSAHPQLGLLGLDRDPHALAAAAAALDEAGLGTRVVLRQGRFDHLDQVLDELGIERISAALFDLGVSSPQLDRPERGFSYRAEGPLDMRMDPSTPVRAADVVNDYDERELARVLAEHGEARFARRIARAIVGARPLSTTTELAEVVRNAIPAAARRTGGHPAKRAFQAIRVEVNRELDVLGPAIDAAVRRLASDGRIAVLSYHSGEDQIVKDRLRVAETGGCTCPPRLPCGCGATPLIKPLGRRARQPAAEEVAANPRAESARLRVAVRLSDSDCTTPTAAQGA